MFLSCLVTLILTLLTSIAAYVLYMTRRYGELQKRGFVGPKTKWVFGTADMKGAFAGIAKSYTQFKQTRAYAMYGLSVPNIYVSDLDILRDVFVKNFNQFSYRGAQFHQTAAGHDFLEASLLTTNGLEWRRARKTLSPLFASGKVKQMATIISAKTQDLVDEVTARQQTGEPVEVMDMFSSFSMDVIAEVAFGVNISSTKQPNSEFVKNGKLLSTGWINMLIFNAFFPFLPKFLRPRFITKDTSSCFRNFIDDALEKRKGEVHAEKKQDFIQMILDAEQVDDEDDNKDSGAPVSSAEKKPPSAKGVALSRKEIHNTAFLFLLAGHDTMSQGLSFALFQLAMHPDILQKAQAEIDEQLRGEQPDFDNVQKLAYLSMCLDESMRLYPPGFILERQCVEDVTLHGVDFRAEDIVSIPVWAIHRDPDLWPQPEVFDPERFTPENKEGRHPCAFLPWGLGPRNCIGMRLAQIQLKLALAAVLQQATPVRCPKTVFPVELQPARLHALHGLWIAFEKRT